MGIATKTQSQVCVDDLIWLRRGRDRIDREFAEPLDVQALAMGADPPHRAGHGLLRSTDLSVTDICFGVGCSSSGTFSTRFKELVQSEAQPVSDGRTINGRNTAVHSATCS